MGRYDNVEQKGVPIAGIIGGVLLVLVIVTVLFGSWYTVRAGERAVVLTWGQPSPVAEGPGIHLKIPIAQDVVHMSVQTQKFESDASAASQDLQTVSAKVTINYRLSDQSVVDTYSNLGVGYADKVIPQVIQESVKASTAKFTAEQLITQRESVKIMIEDKIRTDLLVRNIVVEGVFITNFDFSAEFNKAIEQKVVQEQQALQAKNKLEQTKYEAEQVAAKAEGDANAIRINADANAYEVKVNADAQAYSLRVVREELQQSEKLITYKQIEKWNGEYPQYMATAMPLPMMDVGN